MNNKTRPLRVSSTGAKNTRRKVKGWERYFVKLEIQNYVGVATFIRDKI